MLTPETRIPREETPRTRFKRSGEFESSGLVEELPPTPISSKASRKLMDWGVDPETILGLRDLTSSFRHDLADRRLNRLSKENAQRYEIEGQPFVNFPSFYDADVRRLGGNATDIANGWIVKANDSGLMDELNKNIKDGNRIVTVLYSGKPDIYFTKVNKEKDTHFWNGLALLNKNDQLVDDEPIYIDASFQNIEIKGERKYEEGGPKYEEVDAIFDEGEINISRHEELPILEVRVDANGFTFSNQNQYFSVLGVSPNREYAYSFGLAKDQEGKIRPILNSVSREGDQNPYMIGDNNEILPDRMYETLPENIYEVGNMLGKLREIKFVNEEPTKNTVPWKRKK